MSDPDSATSIPWWRVRVSPARQAAGILLLLLALAFFYVMLNRGMRFYAVSSISMEPTFHDGDLLVAFPAAGYARGDIVVLRDPVEGRGHIVKRVIGLPGDTIEVLGGGVRLNGVYVSEPYRPEPIDYILPEYTVPEDSVFVLGDNTNWSVDSHDWAAVYKDAGVVVPGAVPMDSVQGRVQYRYLPFGHIGPVEAFPIERMVSP